MPASPFYPFPDDGDDTWEDEKPDAEPLRFVPGGGNVSAIATWYQGKEYRSRTEARWALWFDEVGIPFRHEEQPYGVDGRGYLPDFHLRDRALDVEIKRDGFAIDGMSDRMFQAYADGSERRLLVISGWPVVAADDTDDWYGKLYLPRRASMPAVFVECPNCHRVGVLAHDGNAGDRAVWIDTSLCRCRHSPVVLVGPKINEAISRVISHDWGGVR